MAIKWTRFTKGDCPICQGARKDRDCRQSPKGTVHCRSGNPAPSGWQFLGEDSIGFGIYIPVEGEIKSQPLPTKPASKQPALQVLGAVDRDRQFRQIAKHSGLSQLHRAKLQQRGVAATTIQQWYDSGLAWSWSAEVTIPGVTPELPGVQPATGKLRNFHGMAIAIPDVEGRILGFQIKSDRGQQNYFWGSSASLGGNNQRLKNGETPLGLYGQPSTTLDFCEGYLKGAVAADRHSICCVGMMGGHWDTAPQQLKQTIQRTGATTFILNPDAGMLDWNHRTVILAYSRLEALLRQWGYTLQVRWWDQQQKRHGDIDEISTEQVDQAPLIPWTDFLQHLDYEWDIEKVFTSLMHQSKKTIDRCTNNVFRGFGSNPDKPRLKPQGKKQTDSNQTELSQPETTAITLWQPQKRAWLEVQPGVVPTYEEWKNMGSPQLYAERDRHNEIKLELLQKGFGHILENGTGGDGKSHRAGEFAEAWPTTRSNIEGSRGATLHFVAPNYRNPDTETLEKIEERVSPAALDYDHSKLTPLGYPHRYRHTERDKEPDIAALCSEDTTIQRIQQKSILIPRGVKEVYCQDVCGKAFSCPYLQAKHTQGYPAVIREHLSTVTFTPDDSAPGENGDILIIDEALKTINPYSKRVSATRQEIDAEIGQFSQANIDLYQRYKPIFDTLSQGLKRACDETAAPHGLLHAEVVKFLPTLEHLEQLFFECQFDQWLNKSDAWANLTLPQLMARFHKTANPNGWADSVQSASQVGNPVSGEVILTWVNGQALYRTYQALSGNRTNIEISGSGEITFTYKDPRIINILNKARAIIYLDATPDVWELAKKVGVQPNEIVCLSDYRPTFKNLTIKVIKGIGYTCASRANLNPDGSLQRDGEYDIQQRVIKAVNHIAQQSDRGVGLLDYKKLIQTYANIPNLATGYCFNDNRGSNRFKHCSTLISVALPTANLGAKLTQYNLMTGRAYTLNDAPGHFWAWQRRGQTLELTQDGFRLRTQHRPSRPLEWYIFKDLDPDRITELKRQFPGCSVEFIPIQHFCLQAAPKGEQTKHLLVTTLYEQIAAGKKATIDSVAQSLGRSKSLLSRVAKSINLGGWKHLKKSLLLLYKSLESKSKLFEMPEELKTIAQEYLPEIAKGIMKNKLSVQESLDELAAIAEFITEEEYEQIMLSLPPETTAIFITAFLPLLAEGALEWLIRDVRNRLQLHCNITPVPI